VYGTERQRRKDQKDDEADENNLLKSGFSVHDSKCIEHGAEGIGLQVGGALRPSGIGFAQMNQIKGFIGQAFHRASFRLEDVVLNFFYLK